MSDLKKEITELLNNHSMSNENDGKDAILAHYLMGWLEVYESVVGPKFHLHEKKIGSQYEDTGLGQFIADQRKLGGRRRAQIPFKGPDRRHMPDRRH